MTMNQPIEHPHAIVVGSGVAGLATALALGNCTVVTKTGLGDGSSRWAQGGIAAAVGTGDHPSLHAADTVAVSGGLADPAIAELVTAGAPDAVDWLVALGARFDRGADGSLQLGREAGHGHHRIVHADGDATGAELMRTLRTAVRQRSDIAVLEHITVVDLLHGDGRIVGVVVVGSDGTRDLLTAPAVVLATGGIGQVFAATTNPVEVTGDGLAMAVRAGVRIVDPEFVQFHPTALRSRLDPMPLLTEALRGAGAHLIDEGGNRFMVGEHPDAELAPRDIVAMAIWQRLRRGETVLLDATHLGAAFPERFPTVFGSAIRAGIDPRTEGMPVSPAAHYHMGGIATGADGRTSLSGLYAGGEVAHTGLHGANRLASNSLLEGLVFGGRIAASIRSDRHPVPTAIEAPVSSEIVGVEDDAEAVARLRSVMWESVGVMRHEGGLRTALTEIEALTPRLAEGATGRNLASVALTVTTAALARTESRGGHHRTDHPDASPRWAHHTVLEAVPENRHRLRTRLGAA